MRKPYLTKSRFKQGLQCVTQLYYTGKKEYADKNLDDPFLEALAKGGYQVGELAKYYFCDDPVKENISIATLDNDTALKETEERLSRTGDIVVSEAAFRFKNLFIRVDLLVRKDNIIHLYEVKAKSTDPDEQYLNAKGTGLLSKWEEYFYDVAFQRFVITNALKETGLRIKTHLMLVNKSVVTDIGGLHQYFKVYADGKRLKVVVKENLKRADLGSQILLPFPADDICDKIEKEFPVPTDLQDNISFEDFIWKIAGIYANDEKVLTSVGSKCKGCSFYTEPNDPAGTRSGFNECWQAAVGLPVIERTLVTELWNGASGPRSYADELVRSKKYFLHAVEEMDIIPAKSKATSPGLTPHERRMEQIRRDISRTSESYFDAAGLKREMDSWVFPLHMIDFETSAVAVPFFKGLRPYQGVAFQFSHHIIDKDWNVAHKTQYLSFESGTFPNFELVRQLKTALSQDQGSVFRYHNHENTYLRMIYHQLPSHPESPADKDELMAFIDEITREKITKHVGPRDMIDLYQLVLQYYYSPAAKGSNSLKQILPAIIGDSEYLRQRYGIPGIYGRGKKIPSLNFNEHVWITPETNYNPYKTLPKVFDQYERETLDLLVKDMEELADGGTAMTAYNYLQYSEIPVEQRQRIKDSLLRYCELDTLAMVMVVEAWRAKIENL
ncbi:hypothetical protein BH11BAC1_BH11BAC1_16510 [soil metagenome]